MRYPSNQIRENLYTKGFELMLKKTHGNYIGFYYSISGKYFAGAKFIEYNNVELIKYDNKKIKSSYNISQLDSIYAKLNPEILNEIKRDDFEIVKVSPQFSPIPYKRYFIKRKNEINAPIMEVNKDTYDSATLSEFYYVGSIIWGGNSNELYRLLTELDYKIPGIKFYINNISTPRGPDFS